MPFVFEAHGNAIAREGPAGLFEAVVGFLGLLAGEEGFHFFAAMEELIAVAPFGVGGVGK